jgi:hypothetical protein
MLDGVMINLFTLLIGGAGVFSALLKFQARQLHSTFLGSNPFSQKASVIDDVTAKVFVTMAVLGLLIQAYKEIVGPAVPDRIHSTKFYTYFFLLGIVSTSWIVWLCSATGKLIARPIWLPSTVQGQSDIYSSVSQIIKNNGIYDEQAQRKGTKDEPTQEVIDRNFKTAEQRMKQLEKLLEITPTSGTLAERLKRVDPFFKGVDLTRHPDEDE